MSFGYLVNRPGGKYLIKERGKTLINPAYKCINIAKDKKKFNAIL